MTGQKILIRHGDGKLHANENLTASCCRWPVNDPLDPDFHFCGDDKIPGLPYCETHARRAFAFFELLTIEKQEAKTEKVMA